MSQPAFSALAPLPFELVFSDGEPLESSWHVLQIELLRASTAQAMAERGRDDYYTGGDNFVYYSYEQAEDVVKGRPYFRGPDFFFVDRVDGRRSRKGWVAWEEGGRLPDLIVELLSPSTARIDRTVKKDLYSRVFRTREYYLCDPMKRKLEGFRLSGSAYKPMRPNRRGRFQSEVLDLDLGLWNGEFYREPGAWVRLFYPDGRLVPTPAEAERRRAEAAEAELARLRALLDQQNGQG